MAATSSIADPDAVTRAAARVPEAFYRGVDGRAVRQKTDPDVICRHLRLLDVGPGMAVMEIGTGSGLSAALLSELVGPSGRVVSIDLAPELVDRATKLHAEAGRASITSLARDGMLGHPDAAPYDRIIAWTTPPVLLRSWVDQAKPAGIIVQPVRISSMVYATVMARVTVDAENQPEAVSLHRGSYVLMDSPGSEILEISNADARTRHDGETHDSYVSGPWLRGNPEIATSVLHNLSATRLMEASPVEWPQTEHLKTWLIARDPRGLTAVDRGTEIGIGIAGQTALAYITLFANTGIYADSPESPALARLRSLIAEWEQAGRPQITSLSADLTPNALGWKVRASLTGP